ncbi:7520_t:CDS:2 [Rhizophagus irregularis]|nr:7520_t:CDS:2 [Rhizophagus irregularis]
MIDESTEGIDLFIETISIVDKSSTGVQPYQEISRLGCVNAINCKSRDTRMQ